MIMGELGLDGTVRDVPGALPIVELASRQGLKGTILPLNSAAEAVEFTDIPVYAVGTLDEILRILADDSTCEDLLVHNRLGRLEDMSCHTEPRGDAMDFSEIIGQEGAKRGIEIAASGGHNIIRFGFLLTGSYIC